MADGDALTDVVDLSGNGKGIALNVFPIIGSPAVYANLAAFPLVGNSRSIYVAADTEATYRWDTDTLSYIEISPSGGGGGASAVFVADIAALQALNPASAPEVIVVDPRNGGLFVFNNSNMSAFVTADPFKGIYVPPASAPTGASGAYVRHVFDNSYFAEWWLPSVMPTDADLNLNSALTLIPDYCEFFFPSRETTIDGQVSIGKSGKYFAHGPDCYLNGQGGEFWCLQVAASNTEVHNLFAGNVEGQLALGEPGGIHIYKGTNTLDGGGTPADVVENVKIINCGAFNCETGIRAGISLTAAVGTVLANARDIWIINFHAREIDRIGIECMRSHGVHIIEPNIINRLPSVQIGFDRCIRLCGAHDVKINGGYLRGQTTTCRGISLDSATNGDNSGQNQDIQIRGVNFEQLAVHIGGSGCIGLSVTGCYGSGRDDVQTTFFDSDTDGSLGSGEKQVLSNALIANNVVENVAFFANLDGAMYNVEISNNKHIANSAASTRFCAVTGAASEPIYNLRIKDNEHIGPSNTTGGTIRATGTQTGDLIIIDGNRSTADSGGGMISITGNATVIQESANSNQIITGLTYATVRPPVDLEVYD